MNQLENEKPREAEKKKKTEKPLTKLNKNKIKRRKTKDTKLAVMWEI